MKYIYFLVTAVSLFFKQGLKAIYLPNAEHLTPLWARGRQLLRDPIEQQEIIKSAINGDVNLKQQIDVHLTHREPAIVLASMFEGKVFVNVYKPLAVSESISHRPLFDPFWKDCGIFRYTQFPVDADGGISNHFRPAAPTDRVYFDYYNPVISYIIRGNEAIEVAGDTSHACWVV